MSKDENKLDISNLDKAEVLAALYNNAKPLGLGLLQYDPADMSVDEARTLLSKDHTWFDYLKGRVMKVHIDKDILRTDLYDMDNGLGACKRALAHLMEAKL